MFLNDHQDSFKAVPISNLIPNMGSDDCFNSSQQNNALELSKFNKNASYYNNQIADFENSHWLLETIKSLCNDCNKPGKYKEIKKELKQRGIIQKSYKNKPNNKKCLSNDNNNFDEYSKDQFSSETIRNESPFPQVYSTLDIIKQSHYSTILKIQNLIDKQNYALKILTLSENEIASAIHEVQCLAHLKSPRLIRYFSSWIEKIPNSDSLSFYIQTEYFDKHSLQNLLQIRRNDENLPNGIIQKIFIDIATALKEIHQAGIVHRDLQPSNLMFRSDYSIAIVGFSISSSFKHKKQKSQSPINSNLNNVLPAEHKNSPLDEFCINAAETAITVSNRHLGSPTYASPQQLNGRKSCPFDDIYSFGIIMFECLANFESENQRKTEIRQLRNFGILPEKFEQEFNEESKLIHQMTCHDPSKRPTAIQILQTDLFQNWKNEYGQ